MKKPIWIITALIIVVAICAFLLPFDKDFDGKELWENATYTQDTALGDGERYFNLIVTAGEKSISLRILTDKNTVGDALKGVKLIDGEEGPYGIYIKSVNGILADYDVDKSYWAFSKDGVSLSTGADATAFENNDTFELVYTK